MDSEKMQRISLYLDRGLVKRADRFAKEQGFSSRNELFARAVESLMADTDLQDNDILGDKLAEAVLKLSEDNAKAISKGLFRYAVQLEMVMRVLAELSEYTPEQVEEMRREAINNVRRTRGKVSLEDILAGYYDD
ncbi:hypothetical protein I5Q82_02375 [Acutalibacter muris]|uniref:Ribbon-helix-helix protein CopG domain-containing protein n=1 Tax=Acutalibacter muris TaxID=1796620 RepID=A0A1Z2XS98_9FIRM|nr:hypothetical protein [Acutalibacter muris]ANU55436.1 hypothetical protein A4V00_16255 [Hungateiclostridiaceae bacterium KB18]ASB41328.1 hypothetical protein ADH66_12065 [Acutalibacter muris]QQR30594.1 hypothetical protein I5Q82_02375 [Acutalibacter muris]